MSERQFNFAENGEAENRTEYSQTKKSILNMAISDVQQKGSYLQVFDSSGKKISELYASGLDLLGVAGDF